MLLILSEMYKLPPKAARPIEKTIREFVPTPSAFPAVMLLPATVETKPAAVTLRRVRAFVTYRRSPELASPNGLLKLAEVPTPST